MAAPWTEKEINALVKIKEVHPHSSWEYVSKKIGSMHSPDACRRRYAPFAPKLTSVWSLPERRQLAKMIHYEPPPLWKEIGKYVNHEAEDCKAFYEKHITSKELDRGKREAKAEQNRMTKRRLSAVIIMSKTAAPQEKGKSATSTAGSSADDNNNNSSDHNGGEKSTTTSRSTATATATATATIPVVTTTPATTAITTRKRRFWTEKEVEILITMREQGSDWGDIASHVNRTPGACQSKWRRLR
ncbi:hypothetical protein INT45_005057 [Circinella minor]|uniref:Uncharacterized protein n=1 Tax=Circinella minor TaxID=1195481 RepID=A0A8H7SCD8_9FUNG|nr:hypothetical protein INT45_005057 [Circinella minor]